MEEKILTSDGSHSLLSNKYGVSYHSKYGAIQETRHVFIQAAFIPKAVKSQSLRILGMGLGTGLNAFMTFLEAQKFPDLVVEYISLEAYPIEIDQALELNYPEQLGSSEKEKEVFKRIHEGPWSTSMELNSNFSFKKEQVLFEEMTYKDQFDVVYFDAFAPNAQPELWELPMLKKVYESMKQGGVMTTYCSKGAVKRALKSLGFEVQALEGPPGKREMTKAVK